MSNRTESNKIPITLSEEQWQEVEKYSNVLGKKRAEMIRAIVVNWLLDRSNKDLEG